MRSDQRRGDLESFACYFRGHLSDETGHSIDFVSSFIHIGKRIKEQDR